MRLLQPADADASLVALARVVRDVDPFDFTPEAGLIAHLTTLGPFHLRPHEYAALAEISDHSSAYLANLDQGGRVFARNIWQVSMSEYPFEALKGERAWNGIGPSAIWSADGNWAVAVSDEGHGVVAGSDTFVTAMEGLLADQTEDLRELVARLYIGTPEARDADHRLVRMIGRLYGEEKCRHVTSGLGST